MEEEAGEALAAPAGTEGLGAAAADIAESPAAESDGKKKKEKAKDDKQKPGVLGFPPEVAPYKCVVLPLDMRIAQWPEYAAMMVGLRASLAEAGLQYKVDESGATVGRRYARADELGVPFAITIDFDTLGIGAKESTNPAGYATLRERDSTHQVRLPLSDLPTIVAKLCSSASLTWADLEAAHGAGGHQGAGRYADERRDQIPQTVEAGNFVGKEFDEIHQGRRRQHPGRGQDGHVFRQ